MHAAAFDIELCAVAAEGATLQFEILAQIIRIVLGLCSDEIVMTPERAHGLQMLRQGEEDVGRRAGDVEEKADRIVVSARAQFLRQRQQMVVVHPDPIVRPDEPGQRVGEEGVDAQIAAELD